MLKNMLPEGWALPHQKVWNRKTRPKHMQKCIWLGQASEAGENYVATEQGVLKVRTVRRLQPNTKQSLRNTVGHATTIVRKETSYTRRWTTDVTDDIIAEPATKLQRATSPPRLPSTSASKSRPLPDSPWLHHQPDDNIHRHHLDKH